MTNEPAVLVEGIEKSFGATRALNGVSFEAHRGEVLGVLGPNGAGKTTAVNVLSTLIRPDRGRAVVAGHDVVADAAAVRARSCSPGSTPRWTKASPATRTS